MTTDCQSHQVGFKTNWDLGGTFMPYDGLFYPYQEEWLNLGPINEGLDQYNVTYAMINQYYQKYKSLGFHSLSYFDIGNWGTMADANYSGPAQYCGTRPNGLPAPCPTPGEAPFHLLWPTIPLPFSYLPSSYLPSSNPLCGLQMAPTRSCETSSSQRWCSTSGIPSAGGLTSSFKIGWVLLGPHGAHLMTTDDN